MTEPFKIGLIINPIAGMGGSVGLKGTDGKNILEKALELGAEPKSNDRARLFLSKMNALKNKITIITAPNVMGGNLIKEFGFKTKILDEQMFDHVLNIYSTTNKDTIKAVENLKKENISLLVFVGGDGTARDVLQSIGQEIPCLGVPAGVKIHSSVFSINPEKAAQLTLEFLWGEAPLRESEVLDIDEEEFRNNRVISKLYGFLLTPYSPLYSQPSKMASPQTESENENKEAIANWIIEEMDEECYYIIGPGTTTKTITDILNENKTLLGVDLLKNKKTIGMDLNEQDLLKKIDGKAVKMIVTPIGRQGFVFGRGNLQITGKVIEKVGYKNIIIICTKYKFSTIPNGILRIDSRDPEVDNKLRGMYRILVNYGEYKIAKIE
ncbi:MAG: ATP-NAD kinase family protein [archaeon]|nr:ATP-NAD kinase family protein [archaeon]